MGVSVVRYIASGQEPLRGVAQAPAWGVLRGDTVHALALVAEDHRQLMRQYFEAREQFDAAIGAAVGSLGELKFCSPLEGDIQLLCQGLNYADHRLEGGLDEGGEEEENLIFSKAASSICGPNDDILRPAGCELLDYEIELGLVLKKGIDGAVTVTEDTLHEWVGGLVLANDVSARDFMFGAPMMQWFKGKSQRTFCPLGPVLYLLEPADFQQLYQLRLELKLNGETKQDATTDLLIHKPAKTLTELSIFTDVGAGDCLLTGTPGGVLVGINLKAALAIVLNMRNDQKRRDKFVAAQLGRTRFLEPGDQLELSIKSLDGSINLGTQSNTIRDA